MVVAEAQGTGTPPIVAQGPETAAPDFVHHDITGLIYQVGDVSALARSIVAVQTDDASYEHLTQEALASAIMLDWSAAILPHIAQLYRSLL